MLEKLTNWNMLGTTKLTWDRDFTHLGSPISKVSFTAQSCPVSLRIQGLKKKQKTVSVQEKVGREKHV